MQSQLIFGFLKKKFQNLMQNQEIFEKFEIRGPTPNAESGYWKLIGPIYSRLNFNL
jgi:hypothetical protein